MPPKKFDAKPSWQTKSTGFDRRPPQVTPWKTVLRALSHIGLLRGQTREYVCQSEFAELDYGKIN